MKCFATHTYGPYVWELPVQQITFPDSPDKYKWFACCFLEGKVFPALRHFEVCNFAVTVASFYAFSPHITEPLRRTPFTYSKNLCTASHCYYFATNIRQQN